MIFASILVWLSAIVVGMSSEIPNCVDKANQAIVADGLQNTRAKVENYPFGISLLFQNGDYKYDYFFTDDEAMNQEALDSGYVSLGKCLLDKTPVYFSRGSINITKGA
jgi:hypothetical protein